MRLTKEQQALIKKIIHEADSEAAILLFGSRTDDTATGGDIDLFVHSRMLGVKDTIILKRKLMDQLGTKVDLVVRPGFKDAFSQMVRETGITL